MLYQCADFRQRDISLLFNELYKSPRRLVSAKAERTLIHVPHANGFGLYFAELLVIRSNILLPQVQYDLKIGGQLLASSLVLRDLQK